MKKKLLSLLLCTAMTVSLLSGCGNSNKTETDGSEVANEENKQVTLTLINHTSEDVKVEWEDSVISNFEKENPNVKIEVQRMSYDDYIQTIQSKFASGDAPDIFSLESQYLDKYLTNEYVAPLTDTDAAKNFNDGALDMLSKDNEVYAIPYVSNVMDVTYNKDTFEKVGITEVPKTLDEFYAVCDKIKAAGIAPIGAGYAEGWTIMGDVQADYIPGVLLKNNNAILDVQSRKVKFTESEEWKGVFERMAQRMQYVQDDPFGTDWNTACTMLANGEVAMILNGDWTSNNVLAMNPDAKLGSFAFPTTNNAGDTLLAVQTPTEGLAVSGSSPNMEIAKEFLNYYTSSTSVDAYLQKCQEISVIKGASNENATGALADIMDLIANGGAESLGTVNHNFTGEFRDTLQTVLSEYLLSGEKDPTPYLKALDEEFDRIAQD